MRRVLISVAAATLLLGVAGCTANEDLGTKGGEVDIKADMKRIEDNPNMPPQAKAAALAQIKAHQQGSPTPGK